MLHKILISSLSGNPIFTGIEIRPFLYTAGDTGGRRRRMAWDGRNPEKPDPILPRFLTWSFLGYINTSAGAKTGYGTGNNAEPS